MTNGATTNNHVATTNNRVAVRDDLIYYLQRDLATYTCRNLRILARHVLGVDSQTMNKCDLTWLIALQLGRSGKHVHHMNGGGTKRGSNRGDSDDDEMDYRHH